MKTSPSSRLARRSAVPSPTLRRLALAATLTSAGALPAVASSCAHADESTVLLGGSADPPAPPHSFDNGRDFDREACLRSSGVDKDGDGWTVADGDCDDCDPLINPGAYDFPDNGIDEDCSGVADDEPLACDTGAPLGSDDPWDAVRALGLCRRSTEDAPRDERTWGVLSARYVKPDGTPETDPLSHGISPTFGVNTPREGASMLILSTGTARAPGMPGYQDIIGYEKGYTSGAPAGYPKESPACPGITTGKPHDGAGLELTIRVPTNASTMHVDQNFFTLEFPGYVCTHFNDFFVIDMEPRVPTYPDGNIAFDSEENPISVNNALLQVCEPQRIGQRHYPCPLGTDLLRGTGFDLVGDDASPAPHAATGWLTTWAPVPAGKTIRLRFAIWDSSDGKLDSTVLIDRFGWSEEDRAETAPSPEVIR